MTYRHSLISIAAVVVVIAAAIGIYVMWEPAIEPVPAPNPTSFAQDLALRGARVVAMGDCAVCHTTQGGKPYAGGLPLATPFGTVYSTNITPDPQTGIGTWSLEAFRRAMRRGISRDGHQLYPAFPYVHFTRMSDEDIAAAYAYLMRRDPVVAKAHSNALTFPLNFRPLAAFWNVLFLEVGPRASDPANSVTWNRGRELVEGLGHCAACHTPLNLIGAEKRGKTFDGGIVDGWEAPPLNRLSNGPVPWTQEHLVTYLRTGVSAAHGAAASSMLNVTRELGTVPVSDVEAIATYLLSQQKPAKAPIVAANSPGRDPAAIQNGSALFMGACAYCHGEASPMQAFGGRPSLATSSALHAESPRNAIQMMLVGVPWQGEDAIHYMPPFAHAFDDQQVADLAAYLRATYSHAGPWSDLTDTVKAIRKGVELQ